MADKARREAGEDRRVGRHLETALGRVVRIVQADADDLRRARQRRQELHGVERNLRAGKQRAPGGREGTRTLRDQGVERARMPGFTRQKAVEGAALHGGRDPGPPSLPECRETHGCILLLSLPAAIRA